MLWGQRQVQPKWGHQVPSALRVQANDQLSVPADLNFLGTAQSEDCNIMQNGSKEKPDTDQSLAKTQLNNTKVALSSEYWASHALPKNESNLPLWTWAGWKPYQTQPHKVDVLFNWHTCAGKDENADNKTKRQRTGLTRSQGDPNLEYAYNAKTILKCLSCPGSLSTIYNSRTFSKKEVNLTFLSLFVN